MNTGGRGGTVEYLFAPYEGLKAPLAAQAAAKSKGRPRTRKLRSPPRDPSWHAPGLGWRLLAGRSP